MASEDLLFHGKHTESGKRILEYPTYCIAKEGRYWNVICGELGNSGHLETKEKAQAWVERNIFHYVRLSDYQELEREIERLKVELAKHQLDPIQHTGD